MYKVVMNYPNGTTEEGDELFETEGEAEAYGLVQCSNYSAGGEVLRSMNSGDDDDEDDDDEVDDDADFEVIDIGA